MIQAKFCLVKELTNDKITFINFPLATMCFSFVDSNFLRVGVEQY